MKRFLVAGLLLVLGTFGTMTTAAALQSADEPLTEAHIDRIRTHCIKAQSVLNRVHASDGLMRVNRGQLYESIATELMAPLNSRLVLNRIDTLNLVPLANDYNQQLQQFRSAYQQYEVAMTRTLTTDCVKHPETFYRTLADARTKRERTHDASKELQATIMEYGAEFDTFAEQYTKGTL